MIPPAQAAPPPAIVERLPAQAVPTVARGGKAELSLGFQIRAGYHVQANPVEDENLIPTVLKMEDTGGLVAEAPVYPPAARFHLEGLGELPTFAGRFTIRVVIRASAKAHTGLHHLRATLSYQACTERSCLTPRSLVFPVDLKVVKAP